MADTFAVIGLSDSSLALQVDGCNFLVAEEHIQLAIAAGWAKRHWLAGEGLTDLEANRLVVEVAIDLNASHDVAWSVLDRRQRLGERSTRRRVACVGRG